MAAEAWRWTAKRVRGSALPLLVMAGCLGLMASVRGDGALSTLGAFVGLGAVFFVVAWWDGFADSDGVAKVRLSAFAWIVRMFSYLAALFFAFCAVVALFV